MKYIIMCGGWACNSATPKHFFEYKGKPIVQRTIDLLKYFEIEDIAITTSPNCVEKYEQFGVEVISYEANNVPFIWVDAFYPTDEPVCYLFGDVVYSVEALNTIINTDTDDIEFFASAPPFAKEYPKNWAEPFAFKVVNQQRFRECIEITKDWWNRKLWFRHPIAWELWQVIKGTPRNYIVYDNYIAINDYTCDVDYEADIKQWDRIHSI